MIPQATKKRLFVMRSVEVRPYTTCIGWALFRGSILNRLQRLLQKLGHDVTTMQHPGCLMAVLPINTMCAYASQIHDPCGLTVQMLLWSLQELHKNLLEEIEDEHIPAEYGGKETRHLYETEHEMALRQLVKKLSNDSKAS